MLDCLASLLPSCEESGRKGLLDGVGRDDFGTRFGGTVLPAMPFPGGNFEGTVPARALLVAGCALDSAGGTKSGKPS